jgi:hypothetical protein
MGREMKIGLEVEKEEAQQELPVEVRELQHNSERIESVRTVIRCRSYS